MYDAESDKEDPSRRQPALRAGEVECLRRQLEEKEEELRRSHAGRQNDVALLMEELETAEVTIGRLIKLLHVVQTRSDGSKKRAAPDARQGDETERMSGTDDSEATAEGEPASGSTRDGEGRPRPVDASPTHGFDVVRVVATLDANDDEESSTKRRRSLVVSTDGARQTSELATQTCRVSVASAAAVPAADRSVVRVVATPALSTRRPPLPPMPPDGDIMKRLERMPGIVAHAFISGMCSNDKAEYERKAAMLNSLIKLQHGRASRAEFVQACKDAVGTERFDKVVGHLRGERMEKVEAAMAEKPALGWLY